VIPSAVRGIFLMPPSAFFCIRYTGDPFHQQGGDFSQHIGWELGKIPTWWEKFFLGNGTWWEKFLLGNGTWSEKFPHSRKNSDMVGKKDREGYT
jgi:hypothetical protein